MISIFQIIVLLGLCALALAAPAPQKDTEIVSYESEVNPDSYKFSYETSDGVKRQEEGALQNVGTETESIVVKGSFSWIADDGQTYTVTFVADENGFQPEGAHLPK